MSVGPSRGSSGACHCGDADHASARALVVCAALHALRVYLAAVAKHNHVAGFFSFATVGDPG
eukprot:2113096-Prymnesium_polylepis.2